MGAFIDLALEMPSPGLKRFDQLGDGIGIHTFVIAGMTKVKTSLHLWQDQMRAGRVVGLIESAAMERGRTGLQRRVMRYLHQCKSQRLQSSVPGYVQRECRGRRPSLYRGLQA